MSFQEAAVRYKDEDMEPYVCLFRGVVGLDFILLIDQFLESEDIRRMCGLASNTPRSHPYRTGARLACGPR
ncbi:hypothetical protein TNCV_721011 [Trichonephila clavipes]|nr:hypothetical protein TNCV_721011 [Trichonephila clavipes]